MDSNLVKRPVDEEERGSSSVFAVPGEGSSNQLYAPLLSW